jgi:ABC-type lipoprotein export system ATPase subunit
MVTHDMEVASHARREIRLRDGLVISDEQTGRQVAARGAEASE